MTVKTFLILQKISILNAVLLYFLSIKDSWGKSITKNSTKKY